MIEDIRAASVPQSVPEKRSGLLVPHFAPLVDNSSHADTLLEQMCRPAPIRLAKEIVVVSNGTLVQPLMQNGSRRFF
jgi:hypothetical protein